MWMRSDVGPSIIVPLVDMLETPANALPIPTGMEVAFTPGKVSLSQVDGGAGIQHPTPEAVLDSSVGSPTVRVRETPPEELPTVSPAPAGSELMTTLHTLRASVESYASTVAHIVQQTDDIRRSQAQLAGEAEHLVGDAEARLATAISENRRSLDRQIGALAKKVEAAEKKIREVGRRATEGQKTRLAAIEERLSVMEANIEYVKVMLELLNWKARAAEYALNQATRQLKIVLGADALRDVRAAASETAKSLASSKHAALERVKWYAGRAFKMTQELPSS